MQGPGRFRGIRGAGFGDSMECREMRAVIATVREGAERRHEIDDRDRRRRAAGRLHQRDQRRLCRRQGRPDRRRPELLLQRSAERFACRALRRDQAAVRRKSSTPITAATRCCRRCEAEGELCTFIVVGASQTHTLTSQMRPDRSFHLDCPARSARSSSRVTRIMLRRMRMASQSAANVSRDRGETSHFASRIAISRPSARSERRLIA